MLNNKVASTSEVIKKLQEYEKENGVGAITNISTICNGDRDVEYIFKIVNDSVHNRAFNNADNHCKSTLVEISSINDTELFKTDMEE